MDPYDEIAIAVTSAWMIAPGGYMKLFNLFKTRLPTLEQWANHNAKKATPDDLIAGAVVTSFAKNYKHWAFVGSLEQKWDHKSRFISTSLSRKMVGKKHVTIVFTFRETERKVDEYGTREYTYVPIGCDVNGVRVTDAAFKYIYANWLKITKDVKKAEKVAAEAEHSMKMNETKWDLACELLGMKQDKLGRLVPIKTVEGETACQ